MINILKDLCYTGLKDKPSKRKNFVLNDVPNKVEKLQNISMEEFNLQGLGLKIITSSNILDIYTRLEVSMGIKLSGHSDIFTEVSNFIDELRKIGDTQTEQHYRYALGVFNTDEMEIPSKFLERLASDTRPKIEEHILIVMNKSTREKPFFQPIQTNSTQFKTSVAFLFG